MELLFTKKGDSHFQCENCGTRIIATSGHSKIHHSYDPQHIHHISPSYLKFKYDAEGNIDSTELFVKGENIAELIRNTKQYDVELRKYITEKKPWAKIMPERVNLEEIEKEEEDEEKC